MSARGTRGGRRSTCSISGGRTSTGWEWRAASACRGRGSRIWRSSTAASPMRSPRPGHSSSRSCCRKNIIQRKGREGYAMVAKASATLIRHRVLCVSFASFALPVLLALALLAPITAWAACTGPVADGGARVRLAAAGPEGGVGLTFLGHASFLIESPQGVRIVTDYNDMIRAPLVPDIVTMNNAHPTHYSDNVEAGVKFVLRGWDPAGGV